MAISRRTLTRHVDTHPSHLTRYSQPVLRKVAGLRPTTDSMTNSSSADELPPHMGRKHLLSPARSRYGRSMRCGQGGSARAARFRRTVLVAELAFRAAELAVLRLVEHGRVDQEARAR
jgi:hypothetical protein